MKTNTFKKSRLAVVCALGTAVLGGVAYAVESAEQSGGWSFAPGEGLTYEERPIASAEFSLAFDSKYLTYGLVDNNDPILTPGASLTFFDWVTFGVSAIVDMTRYGEGAGYHGRPWMYSELDPSVSIGHAFSHEDAEWIPECLGEIEWSFGYLYERHPVSMNGPDPCGDDNWGDQLDTQFLTFEVSLGDLWLEPKFYYEKDIDRDHGTYLNLEIGHTFSLIDGAGEDDDPVLSFRPSIGQGWGDRRRVSGYNLVTSDGSLLERNGLMDTAIKGELTWNICSGLALSGYVMYSDYIFDRHTREAARRYEARGEHDQSYNFVGGLSLTATF